MKRTNLRLNVETKPTDPFAQRLGNVTNSILNPPPPPTKWMIAAGFPDDEPDWLREKAFLRRVPVSRSWLYGVRDEPWMRYVVLKGKRSNVRGIVLYHLPTILAHLDRLADGGNANPLSPEGDDE